MIWLERPYVSLEQQQLERHSKNVDRTWPLLMQVVQEPVVGSSARQIPRQHVGTRLSLGSQTTATFDNKSWMSPPAGGIDNKSQFAMRLEVGQTFCGKRLRQRCYETEELMIPTAQRFAAVCCR